MFSLNDNIEIIYLCLFALIAVYLISSVIGVISSKSKFVFSYDKKDQTNNNRN